MDLGWYIYTRVADKAMRCRWGDEWGSSGEGNEVIAVEMGVAGTGLSASGGWQGNEKEA